MIIPVKTHPVQLLRPGDVTMFVNMLQCCLIQLRIMRLSIIPPTKYLSEFAKFNGNGYHMVLAQRFLDDDVYAHFYIEERKNGGFLILDNGACELGCSLPGAMLFEAASKLSPNVLVLPDELNNSENTMDMSGNFLKEFAKSLDESVSYMGVVQGRTKDEWLTCFKFFADHDKVPVIGLSNTNAMFPSDTYEFSRIETINFLSDNNMIPANKSIHLLGLNSSGHMELKKLRNLDFIEGADSSAPVVHGYHGVRIVEDVPYKKIPSYLYSGITLDEGQISLVKDNLRVFYDSI